MTAIPLPKTSNVLEDGRRSSLFPVKEITKNLVREFDTPQVNEMISRMSTEAYISASEYMQVFVRVRPFSAEEIQSKEDQSCMEISDNLHTLTLNPPKESNKFKSNARGVGDSKCKYSFTKVFSAETGQKEFFEGTALKIVENFLGGQNSLIFTYGVTSSGKTYTMQGEPGNEGIMPRSVDVIFNSIGDQVLKNSKLHLHNANSVTILDEKQHLRMEMQKQEVLALADVYEQVNTSGAKQPSLGEASVSSSICDENSGISTSNSTLNETKRSSKRSSFLDFVNCTTDDSLVDISGQGPVKFIIFVSFIEIYKECIYDLFEPVLKGKKAKRTPLRMGENKGLPFVKNVREIQVCSREEIFKLLAIGQKNLHMAETNLNHNSSRSHCIFTIKTICTTDSGSEIPNTARVSQLSFCDLAGSERWGKTNSFGERLKEAGKINTSMLTLGKCIEALRHNQQHRSSNPRMVPFRESRLTRLFQSVLQGHGRACMVVNINQCASMFDETAHALKFSAIASEIIERPRVTKSFRASKRPASMDEECPIRPKRFTIGWEPAQTPIKEQDETVEAEETEAAEDEEEEYSSEEEHDEEYWLERESRFLKAFDLMKQALKQEKENVIAVEKRIREECAGEMRRYFVNVEEEYEERLEREIREVENEGEKKYTDAVNLANNIIKELHEKKKELEKEVESLEEDIEALENQFDTEVEQNKTKQTEVDRLKEALAAKEKEMSILAKSQNLKGKTKDADGSFSSADVSELEEQIKCLQKENDEGKEIIQEQLADMKDMGEALEKMAEDIEHQKTESNSNKEKLEKQLSENLALASQIEALTSENSSLSRELENLKTQSEKSDDIERGLREKVDCLKKEIEQSRESYNESKADLASSVENLNEKLREAEKEFENQQAELNSCKTDAKDSEVELKSCKVQLGKLSADLAESESNLQKVKIDFVKSRDELDSMTNQLESTRRDLEMSKESFDGVREKLALAETSAAQEREKMEGYMNEIKSLTSKIDELTITLEEAINCGELKSAEVGELKTRNSHLRDEANTLKEQVDDMREEKDEVTSAFETEKTEKLAVEEKLLAIEKEKENLCKKSNLEVNELKITHEDELKRLEKSHEKSIKDLMKAHHKEILSHETSVRSASDELEEARKELKIAGSLEKQLMSEVDRLQSKVNKLEADKSSSVKREAKQEVDLSQDVKILTQERDDLLKSMDKLSKGLIKANKEKESLQESMSRNDGLNVAEASVLEKLKETLNEMDKLQETQHVAIEKYEKDAQENAKEINELKERIESIHSENQKLLQEKTDISSARDAAEMRRSEIADASKKWKNDVDQLREDLEEQRNETKAAKRKTEDKDKEIKRLHIEIENVRESKEKELKKFREARDRISSVLEKQINDQKVRNDTLRVKLDDQIEETIKLRSENSGLKAQLQVVRPGVSQAEVTNPVVLLNHLPLISKSIKQEISSISIVPETPHSPEKSPSRRNSQSSDGENTLTNSPPTVTTMLEMSTCMTDSPMPVEVKAENPVESSQASEDKEESPPKTRGGRSRRTTKSTSSVKKTSSRRKRGTTNARPATPIPELPVVPASDEFDPPSRRTRITRASSSVSGHAMSEVKQKPEESDENESTVIDQVLDGSDLVRATGNSQQFPKSEMEIDVTPVLKKTRGRKKLMKIPESSVDPPLSKSKSKRRGRGATKEIAPISDEDKGSKVNMARMGDIIKNSPVGQAFKKFEAAISPSRPPHVISGPTDLNPADSVRQSTRRVRKLHAEDISLPFDSTPDDHAALGSVSRGVGLLSQTQNLATEVTRKLRRRK